MTCSLIELAANQWHLFIGQSCIKVALDFVSPENVRECIRLTEQFRLLPKWHRVNEDKLEVCHFVHAPVTFANSFYVIVNEVLFCLLC